MSKFGCFLADLRLFLLYISLSMKSDFRRCMIWLHTYSGLVVGWLLFAIFVTGTLSYFTDEISVWMKPELKYQHTINKPINHAINQLSLNAQNEKRWRIFAPNSRVNEWVVQWGSRKDRQRKILSESGFSTDTIRDTKGGDFFRTFHYTLELRAYGGRYFSGIAAMFMLVATFSGIFTHRRFFKDFFTLRKIKAMRLLTDAHAILGIITLPFCIMICTSALLIYTTYYNPWSAEHYYSKGAKELNSFIIPALPRLDKNSPAAKPIEDFTIVQTQINDLWRGERQIARITFEQPYQLNGRIIVERVKDLSVSNQAERLVFSANTGEALESYTANSTAMKVRRIFYGLHEAKFADPILRWLFFIVGSLASALIATGLILWLSKRIEKVNKRHLGHFIVERLNIGGILGLLIAIVGYFYSNRLLPLVLEGRAELEVNIFLLVWLTSFIHAFLRPAHHAWGEQLFFAGVACLILPIVDYILHSEYLLSAINQGNTAYLTFTALLLFFGVIFLKIAFWKINRNKQGRQYA